MLDTILDTWDIVLNSQVSAFMKSGGWRWGGKGYRETINVNIHYIWWISALKKNIAGCGDREWWKGVNFRYLRNMKILVETHRGIESTSTIWRNSKENSLLCVIFVCDIPCKDISYMNLNSSC